MTELDAARRVQDWIDFHTRNHEGRPNERLGVSYETKPLLLSDLAALASLAAAADAPLPEPAKITYGPRVPSRRVDLSEWDSHRPDFLPAGPSPAVLPQPSKDQR